MGAPALTTASVLTCPHGGKVTGVAGGKLKAGGAPVLTDKDAFTIAGCAFTLPNGKPSPCLSIEWKKVDLKPTVAGGATLSSASVGVCKADTGAPQGTVLVVSTQPSVKSL